MRPQRLSDGPKRGRQRGAAAVFVAIALAALLASLALVVDAGRLYNLQRELQSAANLAALDAARIVGQCDSASQLSPAHVRDSARQSLLRNGVVPEVTDAAEVRLGHRLVDSAGIQHFQPVDASGESNADAVHVTLRAPAPPRILPFMRGDTERMLRASAAAHQPVSGTLSVKSRTLQIDSDDAVLLGPLLSGLLGGSVSLSVADFNALLGAVVDLGTLAVEAGVAQSQLVNLNTDLPGALQLVGQALEATGDLSSALAADTLFALAAVADPGRSTDFGDILDLDPELESSGAQPLVNAADLLMALAQAAGQGVPVTVPLGVNLPGLASVNATVQIGDPPQLAVGRPGFDNSGQPRTLARSAQVQVALDLSLLEVLGGVVGLNVEVDAGQGAGWIEEVQCARSEAPVHRSRVRGQGALLALRAPEQTVLNVLGLVRVELSEAAAADGGNPAPGPLFDLIGPFVPLIPPPAPEEHSRSFGSAGLLGALAQDLRSDVVSNLNVVVLGVLPLPVGQLLASIVDLLDPVLSGLDLVLEQLFGLLGVTAGGGVLTIEALTVEPPRVFTTAPITNSD